MGGGFYPDGRGLFQNDHAPVHRAQGPTEWFDEEENDANDMLRPSRSAHLNPVEHRQGEFGVTCKTETALSVTIRHHHHLGKKKMVMPRSISAALVARDVPTPFEPNANPNASHPRSRSFFYFSMLCKYCLSPLPSSTHRLPAWLHTSQCEPRCYEECAQNQSVWTWSVTVWHVM